MTIKRKLILFLSFSLVATWCMAQPDSGNPGIFESVNDAPIDGAMALLTLTGLGIGVKKLYQRKK